MFFEIIYLVMGEEIRLPSLLLVERQVKVGVAGPDGQNKSQHELKV